MRREVLRDSSQDAKARVRCCCAPFLQFRDPRSENHRRPLATASNTRLLLRIGPSPQIARQCCSNFQIPQLLPQVQSQFQGHEHNAAVQVRDHHFPRLKCLPMSETDECPPCDERSVQVQFPTEKLDELQLVRRGYTNRWPIYTGTPIAFQRGSSHEYGSMRRLTACGRQLTRGRGALQKFRRHVRLLAKGVCRAPERMRSYVDVRRPQVRESHCPRDVLRNTRGD